MSHAEVMDLGNVLAAHANTMKRMAFKTQRLIEIQNIFNEANAVATQKRQNDIAKGCVEKGNLIHKLERLQEETRRTTEELKRKQYALHEKADDAVCANISNLQQHRKMAKLSEEAAQSSIKAQGHAVEELSAEIEVQRKAKPKVANKSKLKGSAVQHLFNHRGMLFNN